MQKNYDVKHEYIELYSATNQFPELQFLGPHNKPNVVRGIGNHYHMHFDLKLGHDTCEIRHIPCAYNPCTSIMDQPWVPGMLEQKQHCYQPVKYFTYWPVFG